MAVVKEEGREVEEERRREEKWRKRGGTMSTQP